MGLLFPAGKLRAEVGVQDKHVRLIDRNVVSDRPETVTIGQGPVHIQNRLANVAAEMFGYLRSEPRVCSEPGRMHKMVERQDRLEAILTALHEHLNVMVQCLVVEWRRRTRLVDVCWLHPAPFYPETECVETKVSTTRKILRITIPKVGALAGFRYFSLSLCGRPVGLGLAEAVVVTLGLIGRSRDAPKKIGHCLSGFAVALLACGNRDRFGLVVRHFESRHLIGHERPDNRPGSVRSAQSESFAPHLLDSDWIIEQRI